MHILEITEIDDHRRKITMPIGVIKEWVDHRILFAQPVFTSVVC